MSTNTEDTEDTQTKGTDREATATGGTSRAGSHRRLPAWWLVVIGLTAGLVLGLAIVALTAGRGGDRPPTITLAPAESVYPPDQAANATELLAAWQRYREATFVAESTFTRTRPGGEPLEFTRVVVQDPPRRLVRQGQAVSDTSDDGSLLCEPLGDEIVCTEHGGVDYTATVTAEVDAWRTAIAGRAPPYAVRAPSPGCFELELVAALVAPPYGEQMRLCFDEQTGAIRSREITDPSGSETEAATALRSTLTAADWVVPGG